MLNLRESSQAEIFSRVKESFPLFHLSPPSSSSHSPSSSSFLSKNPAQTVSLSSQLFFFLFLSSSFFPCFSSSSTSHSVCKPVSRTSLPEPTSHQPHESSPLEIRPEKQQRNNKRLVPPAPWGGLQRL